MVVVDAQRFCHISPVICLSNFELIANWSLLRTCKSYDH